MISSTAENDFEYHYVLFECETDQIEAGFKFDNWKITDFDDYLGSNSYIENDVEMRRARN